MIQMMSNSQIKLYSCQIYNQILKNIAVKCDLCYLCISCCEVFPFQEISDNEFVYENSSVEDTYDHYNLMDTNAN